MNDNLCESKTQHAGQALALQPITDDLRPEYMRKEQAAQYILSTVKKLAIFRKYGMLKAAKLGKEYVYKKTWLDDFMEEWAGYDLSNPQRIAEAIKEKQWRRTHGCTKH